MKSLIEEVQFDHLNRLDRCETLPLVPKKRAKKRPNTALISEAAKEAYENRMHAEGKKY